MDSSYFGSYEDLQVHKLMLDDTIRVKTYRDAIFNNRSLFNGRVVLDIGAGTGILSIFAAQAGARKVYAVEGASLLIPLIKQVVVENEFIGTIDVIEGSIESIDLPEMVDIILSEWMGFYLLHEGMLDSVIYAKKYLKENGLIFPDECKIFLSLCELPSHNESWDNVHGVKMECFGDALRQAAQNKPDIMYVDKKYLLCEPVQIYSFKISDACQDQFNHITYKNLVCVTRDGKYQGVCIWFSVSFPSSSEPIILSTSPFELETHWKQTVLALPLGFCVEEGDPQAFEITFLKNEPRNYRITFSQLNSDDVEHPCPCDCNATKCTVIKAFLASREISKKQ